MHRRCQLGPAPSLEPMAAPLSGPAVGSLAEPSTEPTVSLMAPFPGVTPEFVWNSTCVRVGKLYHPLEDGIVASEDTCVCVRVAICGSLHAPNLCTFSDSAKAKAYPSRDGASGAEDARVCVCHGTSSPVCSNLAQHDQKEYRGNRSGCVSRKTRNG